MDTRFQHIIAFVILLTSVLSMPSALLGKKNDIHSDRSKNVTQTEQTGKSHFIPNVIVVKFKYGRSFGKNISSTGIRSIDKISQFYNIYKFERILKSLKPLSKSKSTVSIESIYYAHFMGNQSPDIVAKAFHKHQDIEYAEPLYIYRIKEIPNDPHYNEQTYVDVINAPESWDVVKGAQGDVVVAIVDGGTDIDHPDISANLWVNPDEMPNNGIDDDNNGFVDDVNGWNFANDSNDPSGLPETPVNANHGTMTAGIACAVTNNNTGIAGVSWNARLMAINAGASDSDTSIVYGFQGILYGVNNGADIISLSWGNLNISSQFAQDIVNYANDNGATVIAAAGNSDTSEPHFPSGYNNVLSVTATNNNDQKAYFSNYGETVDISAPGVSITSTTNDGGYGSSSGTSFSCPIIAGVAALVKTQHPEWNSNQVAEQVRITADNIDDKNPQFAGDLGKGRVNAFKAVTDTTLPSIRITDIQFMDENDDSIIKPGESVDIIVDFFNYLHPASNVTVTLETSNFFVTILQPTSTIPSIGTLETATLSPPFTIDVSENTPRNSTIDFSIEISAGEYQEKDSFQLTVLPNFRDMAINNIETTFTNLGRIGFADTDNQTDGVGFLYKGGPNILFEGAIIAGTGSSNISNAARSTIENGTLQFDTDFSVTENGDILIKKPGEISDQETIAIFDDRRASFPLNIRIKQQTYAWNLPVYKDFIILRYFIENIGSETLNNFHFGIFFDWDIDGEHYITNIADYDSSRKLGYAYDSGQGPNTYVGISALLDADVSYRAIYNNENHEDNPSWGIYDGFTNLEKWEAISGGTRYTQAGPQDISHAIASGPLMITPNDTVQIGFAFLGGDNLNDLKTAADTAKAYWDRTFATEQFIQPPEKFALSQNYPNPFYPDIDGTTIIPYNLPSDSDVELMIFNVLGQTVKTLVNKSQPVGSYSPPWNGKNDAGTTVPNGIYFIRLKAKNFTKIQKMVLVR